MQYTIKKPVCVYTVPHTGTHFAFEFLHAFGVQRYDTKEANNSYLHIHTSPNHIHRKGTFIPHYVAFNDCFVLSTLRHPYRCLVSHMSRKPLLPMHEIMERVSSHWESLLHVLPQRSHKLLFIECPEKHRYIHLKDVADYLFEDSSNFGGIIHDYAEKWKPQGVIKNMRKNPLQIKYKKNPDMLDCFDLTPLDSAVNWYNEQFKTHFNNP